ncbi:MAG: DUF2911 domain-containing protein [Longimicrobiaceae bacterium]
MVRSIALRRAAAVAAALAAFAATGARAQQQGQQRPILSPRDTVSLELGTGRRIYIDYGRPSMRGRRIMGGLVPYGRVWRTGANAATTLVTDVDLELGGTEVRRGTYTLYTIPTAGGWTLIVNRQTGQWGTQYEPARDFARIPMQVSPLRAPVEQFTINLERSRAGAGTLALEWETTRAVVPFRVAAPAARPRR